MEDPQAAFYGANYAGVHLAEEVLGRFRSIDAGHRVAVIVDELPGGRALLDVGAGTGLLLYLARHKYARLHAVDIAADPLATIAEWGKEVRATVELSRVNVDRVGLPLPAESFDAVTCVALLEFVFDPDLLVTEIARVCTPGGSIIVQVGNIASPPNRVRLPLGRLPRTSTFAGRAQGGALNFFTQKRLRTMLEGAGLEVIGASCSGSYRRVRRLRPGFLASDLILIARKPPPAADVNVALDRVSST